MRAVVAGAVAAAAARVERPEQPARLLELRGQQARSRPKPHRPRAPVVAFSSAAGPCGNRSTSPLAMLFLRALLILALHFFLLFSFSVGDAPGPQAQMPTQTPGSFVSSAGSSPAISGDFAGTGMALLSEQHSKRLMTTA